MMQFFANLFSLKSAEKAKILQHFLTNTGALNSLGIICHIFNFIMSEMLSMMAGIGQFSTWTALLTIKYYIEH